MAVDWNKPLQITTRTGTHTVYNLGFGWKNKRLVQIEDGSPRFPFHDGTLPNVFCPDDDGYVVQFDTKIENKPAHSEEYMNAYKEGFKSALGVRDKFELSILGLSIDDLFKAISEYQEKKS